MLRIVLDSYRSNSRRYAFATIALAMATVVCSLGLSGVRLMSNMWRYPFVSGQGGHITILNIEERGKTWLDEYSLFSFSKVKAVVEEIYPEAEITATLNVPTIYDHDGTPEMFTGRGGGLGHWYLMPPVVAGQGLSADSLGQAVFTMRSYGIEPAALLGTHHALVATYEVHNGWETWHFDAVQDHALNVIGSTGYPSRPGAFGHLEVVRALSNTPSDLVHRVGVALPGLDAEVDDRIEDLKARLVAVIPGSRAIITEDSLSNLDEVKELRRAAGLYTPILLVIALQIVAATALAVVHSRRRELSLLRILGFSRRQVWQLFTTECLLSALVACVLGVAAAKMTALLIFQSSAIDLLPFGLALVASMALSTIIGSFAVRQSVPGAMRNA